MKRFILAVAGFSAVVAGGIYFTRPKPPMVLPADTAAPAAVESHEGKAAGAPAGEATAPEQAQVADAPQATAAEAKPAEPGISRPELLNQSKLVFNQEVQGLLSPETSYEQRQKIWKHLREAGRLDQAVSELEQRVAADTRSADSVAALGEGYYKKAGATDDVREKAILAMNADQTLEAALNLDPANWEARFTKAVGMSYWPAELNKGQEVIDQFQTLIQQQESQTPQPQFARSYLRLGEQYQKAGQPDYALQSWQRGAALFPNDDDLKKKLAAPQ